MYNLLKFVHITSVIIWLGGVHTLMLLNTRMRRARQFDGLAALGVQMRFFGLGVFMPSSIIVLITGVGMVQVGKLGFGQLWISLGFTFLFLSVIIGGVLANGVARKLAAGQGHPDNLRARMLVYTILNLLLLFAAVFVMVIKPA